MTPAALYERQRALVREGLLAAEAGRGPGSGVRATAPAVALLVLSVLATDRLSESDRVRAIASAKPLPDERCPFTHCKSFLDAFATLLATTGKAAAVQEITVSWTADRAMIRYRGAHAALMCSEFAGDAAVEPGLSVAAALNHDLLQQIARDVQAMIFEKFEEAGATP